MSKKKKSREYDFEGRCGFCGKSLNLELERVSYRSVKLTAQLCDKHPEESMILWPQRDDIINDNGCPYLNIPGGCDEVLKSQGGKCDGC